MSRDVVVISDNAHRIRHGIARYPDGWNVIVEIDGRRMVLDPTVPTEGQAEILCEQAIEAWRSTCERLGVPYGPSPAASKAGGS